MDKNNLRKRAKKIRDGVQFFAQKNCKITDNVLELLKGEEFNSLFLYVSIGSEVDTKRIAECFFEKVNVFVPYTYNGVMLPVKLDKLSRLDKVDKLGNVYREDEQVETANSVDVTIVPMLAFNEKLFRLGYGGGYYDKFLSISKTKKIGIAFDEQKICDNFSESYDVPLDVIVTPTAVYGGDKYGKSKIL